MYSKSEAQELAEENRRQIKENYFSTNEAKLLKARSILNKAIRAAVELGLFTVTVYNTDLMRDVGTVPKAISETSILKRMVEYLEEAGYKVEITYGSVCINWENKLDKRIQYLKNKGVLRQYTKKQIVERIKNDEIKQQYWNYKNWSEQHGFYD